jgi:hypothetical protein
MFSNNSIVEYNAIYRVIEPLQKFIIILEI